MAIMKSNLFVIVPKNTNADGDVLRRCLLVRLVLEFTVWVTNRKTRGMTDDVRNDESE